MLNWGWMTRWWWLDSLPLFWGHVSAEVSTSNQVFNLPFLARCSHMFDVPGPCGTHNIWCRPFLRDLTSSGMATSGTFHLALHVGPATLRPSEGCIDEVNTAAAAQAEVVPCDP